MDTTTFRILETTSTYLGKSFSINQLTKKIKETYGTAYYANIYKKLHDLETQGIMNLNKLGTSSIVELNFRNYLLIDFLAEMEIKKKIAFLEKKTDLQIFLNELNNYINDSYYIKSICSIDSERNLKLNKMEYFCLLHYSDEEPEMQNEKNKIHRTFQKLQDMHNIRIDSLILDKREFSDFLESDEINPLKEILCNKTVFFCPQEFWNEIRAIIEKRIDIKTEEMKINPAKISERDLIYNLARFGYKEFGLIAKQGKKICIEYIITSLLMQDDARRIEAIPIIMAKHNFNSNLLIFLSQKFNLSERLLSLLKILANNAPNKEVDYAIKLLEVFDTNEIIADENNILEKMRLYNAI